MELGVLAETPTERVRVLHYVRSTLMEEVKKRVVEEVVGHAYEKHRSQATQVTPGAHVPMLFTLGSQGRAVWVLLTKVVWVLFGVFLSIYLGRPIRCCFLLGGMCSSNVVMFLVIWASPLSVVFSWW